MITVITPASPVANTWLVTRDSIKTDLGISGSGSDTIIDRMIAAATALLARRSDRAIWASEVVEETIRLSQCRGSLILLRRPVSAITHVIVDGDTLPGSDYELDGRLLYQLEDDERIEWEPVKTVVRYTGGYALPVATSAPADLADACRTLVKGAWFARARDPSVKSIEIDDVGRKDLWVGDIPVDDPDGLPADIAALCLHYRYV